MCSARPPASPLAHTRSLSAPFKPGLTLRGQQDLQRRAGGAEAEEDEEEDDDEEEAEEEKEEEESGVAAFGDSWSLATGLLCVSQVDAGVWCRRCAGLLVELCVPNSPSEAADVQQSYRSSVQHVRARASTCDHAPPAPSFPATCYLCRSDN